MVSLQCYCLKEMQYYSVGFMCPKHVVTPGDLAVADPGFPIGGTEPLGGADLQHGCFLARCM